MTPNGHKSCSLAEVPYNLRKVETGLRGVGEAQLGRGRCSPCSPRPCSEDGARLRGLPLGWGHQLRVQEQSVCRWGAAPLAPGLPPLLGSWSGPNLCQPETSSWCVGAAGQDGLEGSVAARHLSVGWLPGSGSPASSSIAGPWAVCRVAQRALCGWHHRGWEVASQGGGWAASRCSRVRGCSPQGRPGQGGSGAEASQAGPRAGSGFTKSSRPQRRSLSAVRTRLRAPLRGRAVIAAGLPRRHPALRPRGNPLSTFQSVLGTEEPFPGRERCCQL